MVGENVEMVNNWKKYHGNLLAMAHTMPLSKLEMLLQEDIHFRTKAGAIHEIELAPAGKADRPIPDWRDFPIKQS